MHDLIPTDVTLAVIPTVTMLALKHFRNSEDDEGELEPKHAVVRFLLDAWNGGDMSGAHEYIAPDCGVFANGLALGSEHPGPASLKQAVESWRAMAPDLEMVLSQEVGDKHRMAIEFRIRGTYTRDASEAAAGRPIDVEGSAFLTLERGKISEIWTVFDSLALASQTGAADAPVSWPGRADG